MKFTTAFSIDALINAEIHEVPVVVEAEFIPGQPAETDEYGRPTELPDGDKWEYHYLCINGVENPDLTDRFVKGLFVYDRFLGGERPMRNAQEFYQICEDFLMAELNDADCGVIDDVFNLF